MMVGASHLFNPRLAPEEQARIRLNKHFELGEHTAIWMVDPVMACEMLKHNHPTDDDPMPNRNLVEADVKRLSDIMKAGKFKRNGQPAIFAKNGRLNDGQHRLHAIVLSGCTVPLDVKFGVDRDALATNDLNRKRQPGQWLGMRGINHGQTVAAAARLLAAYLKNDRGFNTYISPDDAEALAAEHPGLIEAAVTIEPFYRENDTIPRSVWAFCYFKCAGMSKDDADRFFTSLANGVGFTSVDDPANRLRKLFALMAKERGSRKKQGPKIELIFKAWNAFRRHEGRKVLRIRRGGDAPEGFPHPI